MIKYLMGIKTKLTLKTINSFINESDIEFIELKETQDGISDTTYILRDKKDRKYICKLYENSRFDEVKEEVFILKKLYPHLKVTKPLWDIFNYGDKPLQFFSFIHGDSPTKITNKEIKEIGNFLGKFHSISKNLTSTKRPYTHKSLKDMLPKEFEDRYQLIKDIKLQNDGIIHGDLFPDNTKFIDQTLSGVFDFSDAGLGDFGFDLAVVANSWCFEDIDILLDSYNRYAPKKVYKKRLLEMMKFAALFYATQRYKSKVKDYREYLEKFDYLLDKSI